MKTLTCFTCGKPMSSPVPSDTEIWGTLECSECTAEYAAHVAGIIRDLERLSNIIRYSDVKNYILRIIEKLKKVA